VQDQKNDASVGVGVFSAVTRQPARTENDGTSRGGSIIIPGVTYAYQIDQNQAIGLGLYGVAGTGSKYNDLNFNNMGSELSNFRPDSYALLQVIELGLGYARKINSNFTAGITLQAHKNQGKLAVVAPLYSGTTPIAITATQYDTINGSDIGNYKLGLKYENDAKTFGAGLTYQSKIMFKGTSDTSGQVVYSNAGAGATPGATAGQVYHMRAGDSNFTTQIPESVKVSSYLEVLPKNKLSLEYSWTKYSNNKKISIDSRLTNPVSGQVIDVPDSNQKWSDLHDIRIGWTNTAFESWTFGGGYSHSSAVTNRNYSTINFLPPGEFHHIYLGGGKAIENWRLDAAYEYVYSRSTGHSEATTAGPLNTPSVGGTWDFKGHVFLASGSYYF